jgi:ribosomal protein S18 acetylase RimI-like enzyme
MTSGTDQTSIVVLDVPADQLAEVIAEAMAIYVAAMGYPSATGRARAAHAMTHSTLPSFRFRTAVNTHGRLVGFGYGYTSLPGQWWHDLVMRAVGRPGSGWLENAFELSELHVSPASQGHGVGERILRSLAAGLPHSSMVLSTPEGENRAWRLYRRTGFLDLARRHLFPGDHRPFAVLGTELPLAQPPSELHR